MNVGTYFLIFTLILPLLETKTHFYTHIHDMFQISQSPKLQSEVEAYIRAVGKHYSEHWYKKADFLSFISNIKNSSNTCFMDYERIVVSLMKLEMWPFKFLDASGKIPTGLTGGALTWSGSYDLCNSIEALDKTGTPIRGRYCTVRMPVKINDPDVAIDVGIEIGLCLPSDCHTSQLLNLTNAMFYVPNIPIDERYTFCYEEYKDLKSSGMYIAAIITIAILLALTISGSIIDLLLYIRYTIRNQYIQLPSNADSTAGDPLVTGDKSSSEADIEVVPKTDYVGYRLEWFSKYCICGGFLLAFSIPYNTYKLWNTGPLLFRDSDGNMKLHPLACLEGMRVITMIWIIFVHTFTYQTYYANNMLSFKSKVYSLGFTAIRNGSFSVDTFFFVSALLTAYILIPKFREVKKCWNKVFFWLHFAFHRFMRVAPAWFIVTILFTGLFPYLASGPMYPQNGDSNDEFRGCADHWWVTFLNNWIHMDRPCMLWTWYLSNDYQFSVILAPIFIALVIWHWAAGLVFIIALIVSAAVSTFVITYQNEYGPSPIPLIAFAKLYAVPYTRWGAYATGLLFGWLLADMPIRAENYSRCRRIVVPLLGCSMATLLTVPCIYGLYGHLGDENQPLSNMVASLYAAICRIVFSFGIGIVVYLCATSWIPPINAILSFTGFRVPARLTYCAYLIHPIVIMFFNQVMEEPARFNMQYLVFAFFAYWSISYFVAIAVTICTEVPVITLESLLRRRNKPVGNSPQNEQD